jgi:hypothetical protein
MAANFRIYRHRTRDSLHLKLDGDFDGNSAHELINTLAEHGRGLYHIFIDTNDLKAIHPFGRDVFKKNLGRYGHGIGSLVFIGQNRRDIVH